MQYCDAAASKPQNVPKEAYNRVLDVEKIAVSMPSSVAQETVRYAIFRSERWRAVLACSSAACLLVVLRRRVVRSGIMVAGTRGRSGNIVLHGLMKGKSVLSNVRPIAWRGGRRTVWRCSGIGAKHQLPTAAGVPLDIPHTISATSPHSTPSSACPARQACPYLPVVCSRRLAQPTPTLFLPLLIVCTQAALPSS